MFYSLSFIISYLISDSFKKYPVSCVLAACSQ